MLTAFHTNANITIILSVDKKTINSPSNISVYAFQVKKDFIAMLREHSDIDRRARWSDVKKKVDSDPRYKAVDSGMTREDYFRDYCKMLKDEKKKAKEKDREHKREKDKEKEKKRKEKDKDRDSEKHSKEKNRSDSRSDKEDGKGDLDDSLKDLEVFLYNYH